MIISTNERPPVPAAIAAIASPSPNDRSASDRPVTARVDAAPTRRADWHATSPVGRLLAPPLPNERVMCLLAEMRAGDERAWSEFLAAFRPILVAYVRRMRIPHEFWDACVDEVLADESCRMVAAAQAAPPDVTAYFLRAARSKYLNQRRAAVRRQRRYEQAADGASSDGVITTVCSTYVRQVSNGGSGTGTDGVSPMAATADGATAPDAATRAIDADASVAEGVRSIVLERVQRALVAATTGEERTVLTWLADGVSYREIGTWLGITRAAAAKRAWRIRQRLRNVAIREVEALARHEHVSGAVALRILAAFGGGATCLAD